MLAKLPDPIDVALFEEHLPNTAGIHRINALKYVWLPTRVYLLRALFYTCGAEPDVAQAERVLMELLHILEERNLTGEVDALGEQLETRKTIDRAKGILMKSRGISEPEAYDLLRRTAMNQSRKIIDVAQSLIIASGLLEG